MNEELDYAEMLEIPVETVTVKRKERRKKGGHENDLRDKLVEQVNDRVGETESDPAYAESKPIEREAKPHAKREKVLRRVVVGEFVAVCALCAVIFLTNIFLPASAINTFVKGLFSNGTAAADTRTYADFTLSPVVSERAGAELAVSESGTLTFTSACSVYSPCDGVVAAIGGDAETGYAVEIKHSENFSTFIAGLDTVYAAEGDKVYSNLPLGHSDGETEVRVTFFDGETPLTCYTVNGSQLAWEL